MLTERSKRSEMYSLLWSMNLFIQLCTIIFMKLSRIDLLPINLTLFPVIYFFITIITPIIFCIDFLALQNDVDLWTRSIAVIVQRAFLSVQEFTRLQWLSLACCNFTAKEHSTYDVGEKQRGMTLFFNYWIISSAGSLLASKIFTLGKYCKYSMATTSASPDLPP